jgi:Transglycosylase SLT domain
MARGASTCRSISFSQSLAARPSPREGVRSNPMPPSSPPLSNATASRRGRSLPIWGIETGFGRERGNQNTLSAVATLAYDCRRSACFTDQLYANLTLIDRGILSAGTRGSMHGEIGQTQFLPKTILGVWHRRKSRQRGQRASLDANFLSAHGWRAGADTARRSQFRSYPGMECCSGLSAGHRAYRPTN